LKRKLILGSRGSELALWQSNYVKDCLSEIFPALEIEIQIFKTKGDKILDVPLATIGGKGLFTKELEEALLSKKIDLAVHSLKDLPTIMIEGLALGAITKRHTVNDVIISKNKNIDISALESGSIIATGSLRRKSQLLSLNPELTIVDIRGNVATRIKKYEESNWSGTLLAAAGVERLNLTEQIGVYLPMEVMLPAPGQGALAVQIRDDDAELSDILIQLHHSETALAVTAERGFLQGLGGGCQVPIAAFAEVKADVISFRGFVGSPDGKKVFRVSGESLVEKAELLGKEKAVEILSLGAKEIMDKLLNEGTE